MRVDSVSVECRHRVAALGRVGHIFTKTSLKLSSCCLELLYEQKSKLEPQFYHFLPKMGLKPHAVRPHKVTEPSFSRTVELKSNPKLNSKFQL